MPRWVKVILAFAVVSLVVYVAVALYWLQGGGPLR